MKLALSNAVGADLGGVSIVHNPISPNLHLVTATHNKTDKVYQAKFGSEHSVQRYVELCNNNLTRLKELIDQYGKVIK